MPSEHAAGLHEITSAISKASITEPISNSRLSHLIRTNDAPEPHEIHAIAKLIADAVAAPTAPSAGGEDVQAATDADARAEHIRELQRVLAPVRRVPADVIVLILHAVCATAGAHPPQRVRVLVPASAICAPWRAVALATPPLWAHIAFADPRGETRGAAALRALCIARCAGAPLALHLAFDGGDHPGLEFARNNYHCTRALHLTLGQDALETLMRTSTRANTEFPLLEELNITNAQMPLSDGDSLVELFASAERLTGFALSFFAGDLSKFLLPWARISRLELNLVVVAPEDFWPLVARWEEVEELVLSSITVDEAPDNNAPIVLPRLCKLEVQAFDQCGAFLERLHSPALRDLEISGNQSITALTWAHLQRLPETSLERLVFTKTTIDMAGAATQLTLPHLHYFRNLGVHRQHNTFLHHITAPALHELVLSQPILLAVTQSYPALLAAVDYLFVQDSNFVGDDLPYAAVAMPALAELRFRSGHSAGPLLQQITAPALRRLFVSHGYYAGALARAHVAHLPLAALELLALNGVRTDVPALVRALPALRELAVAPYTPLEPALFRALGADALPRLRVLRLHGATAAELAAADVVAMVASHAGGALEEVDLQVASWGLAAVLREVLRPFAEGGMLVKVTTQNA